MNGSDHEVGLRTNMFPQKHRPTQYFVFAIDQAVSSYLSKHAKEANDSKLTKDN